MKKQIKNSILFIALSAVLGFLSGVPYSQAFADTVVIVNPSNTVSLDEEQVRNIFLGKKSQFPNGVAAKPIDQPDERAVRTEFYAKIAGKNESEMKFYWSTLIFTGNGRPPKVLGDDNDVKAFVRENVNAIGYIDSKFADSSVKVISTLK